MRPHVGASVVLLFVLFLAAPRRVEGVMDPSWLIDRPAHCASTGLLPAETDGLEFCSQFTEKACCVPGTDATAMAWYMDAMNLGQSCSPSKHSVKATYKELREAMCLPCNPREPEFRFQIKYGDIAAGGIIPPDPSAAEDAFGYRMCRTWMYGADGNGGLWGTNGSRYDKCGLNVVELCQVSTQVSYNPNTGLWEDSGETAYRDCDEGVIIPSVEFASEDEPAAAFLSNFQVELPYAFEFVVVDDTSPLFNATLTPCFNSASWGGWGPATIVAFATILLLVV